MCHITPTSSHSPHHTLAASTNPHWEQSRPVTHVWMSHVTYMNESCHTYEWVMWHIWMSHVTHMKESCHTYEWVVLHIWMSHVTHMNESCHTYAWGQWHIWMSHVTHIMSHACVWVISHIWKTLTSSHSCCVNQPSLGAVTSRVYSIGAGLREANAPSPWTKQKKKGKKANKTEKIKLNKRITNKFSLRSLVLKLDRCWFTRGKCSQFLIRKKKEIKRK